MVGCDSPQEVESVSRRGLLSNPMDFHHPQLPITNDPEPVPVYECHVIIRRGESDGRLHGRVTNLPGITASALNERDLLRQLTDEFKKQIIAYRDRGESVPWSDQDVQPGAGEVQRWIPIHL